ncbi:hypothetical protein PDE_06912 [Penicillium oxalicum 114-2]|uniref:Uncharacterized protein n=1 Tax=Penicillium oxalicum (strain 114-2 / CGMCC 5302) TaxID=933388 RepID=S8AZS7_PENO1|nr:hypothetical protein PDE_06912 [Penicillium oxalicum 114-2]
MHFPSLTIISTTLLAVQSSAQFIRKASSRPVSSASEALADLPFSESRTGTRDHAYAIPKSNLAPVDPLQPGSEVAPVLIGKPTGVDAGNAFCLGQCYPEKSQARCADLYSELMFKAATNCWTCCITAGDF